MDRFTMEEATRLASHDRNYFVRKHKHGDDYGVWDFVSDHWVEFDAPRCDKGTPFCKVVEGPHLNCWC